MHGTLFVPEDVEPAAAVLVIGGSGGSEPSYAGEALARAGITALSVAYFARPGLLGQLRDIPLEYFFTAAGILRDAVASPAVPLAVLGMSRGSEAAMLTAIHGSARISGVLATVPGNVVAGSLPPGGPAWLLGGRPLPYADGGGPDCANAGAIIPAERIPGPVLLVARSGPSLAVGADGPGPVGAATRAWRPARAYRPGIPQGRAFHRPPGRAPARGIAAARSHRRPGRRGGTFRCMAQGRRVPPPATDTGDSSSPVISCF